MSWLLYNFFFILIQPLERQWHWVVRFHYIVIQPSYEKGLLISTYLWNKKAASYPMGAFLFTLVYSHVLGMAFGAIPSNNGTGYKLKRLHINMALRRPLPPPPPQPALRRGPGHWNLNAYQVHSCKVYPEIISSTIRLYRYIQVHPCIRFNSWQVFWSWILLKWFKRSLKKKKVQWWSFGGRKLVAHAFRTIRKLPKVMLASGGWLQGGRHAYIYIYMFILFLFFSLFFSFKF
jgi:hypothetical protein